MTDPAQKLEKAACDIVSNMAPEDLAGLAKASEGMFPPMEPGPELKRLHAGESYNSILMSRDNLTADEMYVGEHFGHAITIDVALDARNRVAALEAEVAKLKAMIGKP